MFKLIWFCLIGCLVIGILFVGNAIIENLPRTSGETERVRMQVKAKVRALKESVMEKKKAVDGMLKNLKETGGADVKAVSVPETVPASRTGEKSGKTEAKLNIDPVDDEDRRLTGEILRKGGGFQAEADKSVDETRRMETGTSGNHSIRKQTTPEPVDLDRMASIREIYRKALETLDFK